MAALLVLLALCGCGTNSGSDICSDAAANEIYTSFSQIEDKRIGVTTGSVQAIQAEERFPNAEFFYFATSVDMLNALKSKEIDAFEEADTLVKFM